MLLLIKGRFLLPLQAMFKPVSIEQAKKSASLPMEDSESAAGKVTLGAGSSISLSKPTSQSSTGLPPIKRDLDQHKATWTHTIWTDATNRNSLPLFPPLLRRAPFKNAEADASGYPYMHITWGISRSRLPVLEPLKPILTHAPHTSVR